LEFHLLTQKLFLSLMFSDELPTTFKFSARKKQAVIFQLNLEKKLLQL